MRTPVPGVYLIGTASSNRRCQRQVATLQLLLRLVLRLINISQEKREKKKILAYRANGRQQEMLRSGDIRQNSCTYIEYKSYKLF